MKDCGKFPHGIHETGVCDICINFKKICSGTAHRALINHDSDINANNPYTIKFLHSEENVEHVSLRNYILKKQPRNTLCNCNSGKKWKKCHGKNSHGNIIFSPDLSELKYPENFFRQMIPTWNIRDNTYMLKKVRNTDDGKIYLIDGYGLKACIDDVSQTKAGGIEGSIYIYRYGVQKFT